jgi:alpha-ribazole phosphatase
LTKLILIRHGRTLWNSSGKFQGQSDIELSQEGISQAEKLAENFPVTHIDRVYSSNLKRAYITGEIIAKKFNVPIIKDKRLCEVSFGSWEGLTYDEIHEKWPNEIETMFSTPDDYA